MSTGVCIVFRERSAARWHVTCVGVRASACSGGPRFPLEEDPMTWTKPEFEVVELGMEVGAYAGNA
ncbi:MAG: pyrroloquinoline quinone precursor peptide PqqA [Gemmatimonadetes bacterium]|nr:MAG: pyrroloquinoline quinone precursor peptide PqqA [Gemmatimonadota bacterium]